MIANKAIKLQANQTQTSSHSFIWTPKNEENYIYKKFNFGCMTMAGLRMHAHVHKKVSRLYALPLVVKRAVK